MGFIDSNTILEIQINQNSGARVTNARRQVFFLSTHDLRLMTLVYRKKAAACSDAAFRFI